MKTSEQTRREFIQFFEQRGHTFVPSSSLLPGNDPTLLFANAGMNQFKDVFLGGGSRPYRRAVNSQKCIRAGGKHNDLDDVGYDSYHHTFFEMLGNWSFGDYFKAEAIGWAWELLTNVWGLDKQRLYATVFGGEAASGLAADDEARELWAKVTDIASERILNGSLKDNFWEMGETGPCGPCTEIHYDFGQHACDGSRHAGKSCAVNVSNCSRFIELWNLVFIQFNRDETGKLEKLPARHVDTGMGFERICRVLQGKDSNYETDVFAPLLAWLQEHSGMKYGSAGPSGDQVSVAAGLRSHGTQAETDVAFRVVADHARSCTFAIADGILPSNEGRGYVIRRILRRAARFGRKLGQAEPFLYKLVDVLAEQMGSAFPEVAKRRVQAAQTIHEEEIAFNKTLDRGLDLFERAAGRTKGKSLSGEVAFELYATYGFPVDLTQVMAGERGMSVDLAGYEQEMNRHREISAGAAGQFQAAAIIGLPETIDSFKYEPAPLAAKVLGWVIGQDFITTGQLAAGADSAIVLDKTNFYGESGGQVGDSGVLTWLGGSFEVHDAKVVGHCVLHIGKLTQGSVAVGQAVTAQVGPRRDDTRRNHTATHLLNWALRKVLGEHIEQAGSVVDPERLRFDFTHGQAVTAEQLTQVEALANERVLADEPVYVNLVTLAEARKIPGVRAVFGEKYPDPVRVISVGVADPVHEGKPDTPVEFCGGTHLDRTGQVGFCKIVSEESVAKGVRRITAVTGHGAVRHVQAMDHSLKAVTALLRAPAEALPERIEALQAEIKQLRKAKASGGSAGNLDALAASAVVVGDVKVIVGEVGGDNPEALRSAVDQLRQKAGAMSAILLGSREGEKVTLVAGVSEELVKAKGVKAGDWVKAVALSIGGSGGGKPTMAQAGGKDPEKLSDALAAATAWMAEKLG